MQFCIKHLSSVFSFLAISALSTTLIGGCGGSSTPNPSGTLEATEIDVASTISGRITRVDAVLGGRVQAGDTLVVLDTEILQLQRKQAESGLQTISAQRIVFRDNISQAERNLEYLDLQAKRIAELVEHGTAQQQQLDELTAKRDIARDQLKAVKHQLMALDAEENKLVSSLAVFDRQIEEGVVRAPLSGEILLRTVEPGEIVTPGKTLLRIADLGKMELRVFIGAADLEKVKVGSKIAVFIDAIPNRQFEGVVNWVNPEAEFTPKNAQTKDARLQLVYAVKIAIDNADGLLRIGMPAEAKI